ncbi:MAG: SMP-30/gluconolactonase/LRE family protein [Halieaceae bacterium]|nr:SMP-30/gluconolactonase/LRE family protein [Halieaceae bacterium]
MQKQRFDNYSQPELASDWQLHRLTQPSRLHGANGVRAGADGRVYVAQVAGSQVSAVDIDTGLVELISKMGSDIVAPDDLVFDDNGNMFLTEITEDRVSVLGRGGTSKVLFDGLICANPITLHQGHLITGECRPGGRIIDIDLVGGGVRTLAENVPMPNAFEVGPDGMLYAPIMGTNEIWRFDLNTGQHQVVATDLGVPDSVKFDSSGNIISTQVASGQVLRIDPRTGASTLLAQLSPGLDNCTFVGDRLFVSSIDGSLTEVLEGGATRPVVKSGLQWPLGIAVDTDDELFVADGAFTYLLREGGELRQSGFLFFPGYPGYTRGVVAEGDGAWLVTTSNGQVARTWPKEMRSEELCSGYDRLMGIATTRSGDVIFAEYGTGRVHYLKDGSIECIAEDLAGPTGVAEGPDGELYVSEQDAGRVSVVRGGRVDCFVDGLARPHDISISHGHLYIADAGQHSVEKVDISTGKRETIAWQLPIGGPPGVTPKIIGSVGDMAGPMLSFTGLAVSESGAVFLAGDTEGSVLKLQPN